MSSRPLSEGGPLSPIYWWGFGLILAAGAISAIGLPYKDYSLDLGNYGRAPLKVGRFSGAQVVRLNGSWHLLSGNILNPETARQISLGTGEIESTPEGVKLKLIVKNPTPWSIQQMILGSFAPTDSPQSIGSTQVTSIGLIDCVIRPYSVGSAQVSFNRRTDTSHLQIIAIIGRE